MNYQEEVTKAMTMLAQDDRTVFIGQQVAYSGSVMYGSLERVPMEKRIELPIMENTQLGIAIGMSLAGYTPICIYPRFDFLLLAMNQLVNHLEKLPKMSEAEWVPKVIIRTMVGKKEPLDPGLQHSGDYTIALQQMLSDVDVQRITKAESVMPVYRAALDSNKSVVIIEGGGG